MLLSVGCGWCGAVGSIGVGFVHGMRGFFRSDLLVPPAARLVIWAVNALRKRQRAAAVRDASRGAMVQGQQPKEVTDSL